MSTTVEDPTTICELARYVERKHSALRTSYNARCEQLVVVGQPGHSGPPVALREILGRKLFEMQCQALTDRARWLGVVTATDKDEREHD